MKYIFVLLFAAFLTGCVTQATTRPIFQHPEPTKAPSAKPAPKPSVTPNPATTPKPAKKVSVPRGLVIYGATYCPLCKELKKRLDAARVSYIYYDMDTTDASKFPNDGSALANRVAQMLSSSVPVVVNPDRSVDNGDQIRKHFPLPTQ